MKAEAAHFLEMDGTHDESFVQRKMLARKQSQNRKNKSELFLKLQFFLVKSGKAKGTNGNKISA